MRRIILIVLLIIIFTGGVIFGLAAWSEPLPRAASSDGSFADNRIAEGFLKNGVIELTSSDINYAAGLLVNGGLIRGAYSSFKGDCIEAISSVNFIGLNFTVKTLLNPYMYNGDIILKVKSMAVGKLPIPPSLGLQTIKEYLPESVKVDGDNINIGNRILMFAVKDMYVGNNLLRVEISSKPLLAALNSSDKGSLNESKGKPFPANTQMVQANTPPVNNESISQNKSGETKGGGIIQPTQDKSGNSELDAASGEDVKKMDEASVPPQSAISHAEDDKDKKLEALKTARAQLDIVLNDVKSEGAKEWVQQAILAADKILGLPDGDYTGDINAAMGTYNGLPQDVKNEIVSAISKDMDTSSAMLLASSIMGPVQ